MNASFILVEPSAPENVKASARAIKTTGIQNLLLVNPCDHWGVPACRLAHDSEEIPVNAMVCSGLKEAVADFDFNIGPTAQNINVSFDYHPPGQIPEFIKSKGKTTDKIGSAIGHEESGLRNEKLKLCREAASVQTKTAIPSLNHSKAVMPYALRLSKMVKNPPKAPTFHNVKSVRFLLKKNETICKEAGFKANSAICQRFFVRISYLNHEGIQLLHSSCNKLPFKKK